MKSKIVVALLTGAAIVVGPILPGYKINESIMLEPTKTEVCSLRPREAQEAYIPASEASTPAETALEQEKALPVSPVVSFVFSEEDADYLVKVASCEAGNQGVIGMALVMRVVINRALQWDMSIHDVIFQPEQFNCVYSKWWADNYIADGVYDALALVEQGWDESAGALYFCTPVHNQWHSSHLTFLFQYGNHQFYTQEET